ncbi:unnamed protein product [Euphydryas editha]|uniref:trypsin n=1 Tax=Euphydryas editha TaxID=104508 RepID=A0AAU9UB46_EUPED|nr:unnamed protein product [Euphydryas editha]
MAPPGDDREANEESVLPVRSSIARPNRIVGGQPTTIDRYPSIVQLEFFESSDQTWRQDCGGSIITSRYVVTAAHCTIDYVPALQRIRAGSSNRHVGGVIAYVEAIFIHPSFGSNFYEGDISVVRLTTPLVFSSVIQPTAIATQNSVIPDNLPVVYAGWGHTEEDGESSSILRDVQIYTINKTLCRQSYDQLELGIFITDNMICAGLLDVGGRDACQGDSGGPLYYSNILIGVVSWGVGCGQADYPGVNINVASYTEWIVSIAENTVLK